MKLLNCKLILKVLVVLSVFVAELAFAAHGKPAKGGIGSVAMNIVANMSAVQYFILGACYLLGLGFSASAIFKFKSHKDNPTQIPIGTPIALGFIGAAFLFIPSMFNMAGHTLFGSTYKTGGPEGQDAISWYKP